MHGVAGTVSLVRDKYAAQVETITHAKQLVSVHDSVPLRPFKVDGVAILGRHSHKRIVDYWLHA